MAANLINAEGLQFGVKEDEAGLVITKVTRTFKTKSKPVLSKQGETTGHAFYDPTVDITVAGTKKSTGALITLALGAIATLANATEGHGVTGGTVLMHEATEDESIEEFVNTEIKFTRYPNVTVSGGS